MIAGFNMVEDHAKLIAKIQHYYDFLNAKKEEFNIEFVQFHNSNMFRPIRDFEDLHEEFRKTFEENIYYTEARK